MGAAAGLALLAAALGVAGIAAFEDAGAPALAVLAAGGFAVLGAAALAGAPAALAVGPLAGVAGIVAVMCSSLCVGGAASGAHAPYMTTNDAIANEAQARSE